MIVMVKIILMITAGWFEYIDDDDECCGGDFWFNIQEIDKRVEPDICIVVIMVVIMKIDNSDEYSGVEYIDDDDEEDFWWNIQESDKQVELIYSAADCAHLLQPSKRSRR